MHGSCLRGPPKRPPPSLNSPGSVADARPRLDPPASVPLGEAAGFLAAGHGPLYEKCAFLSCDAVQTIADIEFLPYMTDIIFDEYEEGADEE